jgi:hypothetical protein
MLPKLSPAVRALGAGRTPLGRLTEELPATGGWGTGMRSMRATSLSFSV